MGKLKQELYKSFNGFADKRIKKLNSGSIFIADDRSEKDVGANKQIYRTFCQVMVTYIDEDNITVDLRGNVPDSERVRKEIAALAGVFGDSGASFTVSRGEQMKILNVSRAIAAITGKSYDVPSYKFVCPRTAKSLRVLVQTLSRAWNDHS